MKRQFIGVTPSGVVILGPDISCDGFHRDYGIRVQTHVHLDHMHNFETSKGYQDIYLSNPTLQLLISDYDADLGVRDNLIPLNIGEDRIVNSSRLRTLSSDHMIGSLQVSVELADGTRVGYSGDFQWPLEEVMKVEQLVLDSTYGAPDSIRLYSQEEAEEKLLAVAVDKIRSGPLHIKAHRGTLHRGMQVLSELEAWPCVASPRLCREAQVYRDFGYPIRPIFPTKSPEACAAIKDGRFIQFYGMGDKFPLQVENGTAIILSAFMTDTRNPLLELSERAVRIALTDHADFMGVLEYVSATGAEYVVTDNSRGNHAVQLANEIRERLGIIAIPSELDGTKEWGM